jgi:hypothetical protein
MKRSEFNNKLREYAQSLSPRESERDLIRKIYQSFNDLLGSTNCIQIGSYPRFTAVTPVKDLDILYILGVWKEDEHDPKQKLEELRDLLSRSYENPTEYRLRIEIQSHSVTVEYLDDGEKIFSVDIVPAFSHLKNDFDLDMYMVPEILKKERGDTRKVFYNELKVNSKEMDWIASDPRGYIKVATETDETSRGDFRKAVKMLKKWRKDLEDIDRNVFVLSCFQIFYRVRRHFRKPEADSRQSRSGEIYRRIPCITYARTDR